MDAVDAPDAPPAGRGSGPAVLERGHELATLTDVLAELGTTGGRAVLVRGEAGIGKTTLLSAFVAAVDDAAHVLEGACDDLLTPQPLGPFWDVARGEDAVAGPLATGDRRGVMEALLDLLSRPRPTVLVLEDTQWADEATLDVVTFLGRRIARTNGMLVLTYRDGEVDADHPLRQVIGGLPPQVLVRLPLGRLSADGVAAMIAGGPFDAAEVVALTAGNPLFVTEVLAAGTEAVPSSVREAVLARAAKLSASAGAAVKLLSVIPGGVEHALLDDLLDADRGAISECVTRGLLDDDGEQVRFPHELQRRAVESSLPAGDRRRLNGLLLATLVGRQDPARLVHHAREAGDVDAIIRYAPQAARAAMAIESHREAVQHFRTVEPHLARFEPAELAPLLEDWAEAEFYLDHPETIDLLGRAITLRRALGDDAALARALTAAIRPNEVNGRPERADACATEAVALLDGGPAGAALASALAQSAWLRLMRGDDDRRGVEAADRAIAIAETVGEGRIIARALILKGAIQHSSTDRGGFALVEEGHRRAVEGGHHHEEVAALLNLAGLSADVREIARAADLARRARDTAVRYELRPFEAYALAVYAEILLWQGDWVQAEDLATTVLGAQAHVETTAWRILGLLQARRGSAEAGATLEHVWSLAAASGELQKTDPAASALAEWMWLVDDRDPRRLELLQEVADRGRRSGYAWPSGALTFWMWELGLVPGVPADVAPFYRMTMEGDIASAAAFWESRGAPYDRAVALMHGDQRSRIRALHILEELGATATANRVRAALLEDGIRAPRGRSRATRDHAAGLTSRQAEVLDLLAAGLTNPEIADRLFLSTRTVENHVAAVLMKLDVPTRRAAVDAARDRDLLTRA